MSSINSIEFKPIPGHEKKYGASKCGKIISYPRWRKPVASILVPWISRGYEYVKIQNKNKLDQKTMAVHRLVAMTYLSEWDSRLTVNHKDGNKRNNKIDNLEMMSNSDNVKHAFKNKLICFDGEKANGAKISDEQALFINEVFLSGICSLKELSIFFKVTQCTIKNIVNKKTFKHLWSI